ncbi:unnamed protein product [Protopolystoma xenopodis]|uniref:Uncharacterized protein n=1 Tax=Protopolystoma xenopodis TaxID=117903 RepID=A0A3S5BN73_9PLAT|nr:unnamed protein product [Protopolystoma xenopodis]
MTSCRLALLESEVGSTRRRRRIPLDQLSIGFTGRFVLTLFLRQSPSILIHVGEEIRSSIPPEDDGGFLLTSCRLALLEDSCISEVIFFDSGEKVLSFRPSYDEHHRRRRIPLDQLSIGFTGRFMLTLFPSNGEFLLTSCRLALLEDSC